ncbi:hypothetical protein C8J57DRAFT_1237738 [Mycena rebaudengoi]|nr:hypothetical protein C8J57DRAFT_1237738 [Mycena rebaudengoi]
MNKNPKKRDWSWGGASQHGYLYQSSSSRINQNLDLESGKLTKTDGQVNTNSHRSIAKRAWKQRDLATKIRPRERGQGNKASARCKAQKYRREIEPVKRRFVNDPDCDSTGALADVINVHESDFLRRCRDVLSYRERMLGFKEYYRFLGIARKIDNESRRTNK